MRSGSKHMSRHSLLAPALAITGVLLAWIPAQQSPQPSEALDDGFVITNPRVIDRCSRCHALDDDGRMSRISWLRKTPEGWQTSIQRMVALHGVRLNQADAREIARYLADEQGLAPEELRPGMFEVERRSTDHDWDGDSDVEFTCIQCHSMGRVMTQRRTEDEWGLLLDTHRALYPLVDFQAFRYGGPASEQDDPRHPMERAITHLAEVYPLETDDWTEWAANKRAPRLAGQWLLSGFEPGKGAVFGTVTVTGQEDPSAFATQAKLVYAESGEVVERTGQALVYTGYQWRGRSNPGSSDALREVMFVERDQQSMWGRWFRGDYDELGPDVRLERATGFAISGAYPRGLRRGTTTEVTVYGVGLDRSTEFDFGSGVSIDGVTSVDEHGVRLRLTVATDASLGGRDLFAGGSVSEHAVIVHDGIDRIEVTPETGMARTGGANFPKGYQAFDAIAYDNGPDGEAGTEDDVRLDRVEASWDIEEYAAAFGDDDVDFVGAMRSDGVFDPAADGPNPDRSGNRNNIGDVWAVARYTTPSGEELTARAHLIVTVPLYMRFDPWRPIDDGRPPIGAGGSR